MDHITKYNNICMGCLNSNLDNNMICPACGFDENGYIPSPHHLPLKTIVNGKYLIGKVLGEGGFGITYLAWDLMLEMKVAIKEYYPSGYVTRENTTTNTVTPYTGEKSDFFSKGRERFVNEARSLAKFRSMPGIVTVNDFFLENSAAYIVMEYIDGQTMKAYLASMGGKLPVGQVFEMMGPIMQSLAEVHKTGLVHRDISPDNIMISKEGYVKLLDFGAVTEYENSGERSRTSMVKPGYAPEEQYRTRGVLGPWTDVYALSATMYKMMTGITPEESNERLLNDTLVPPSKHGIDISSIQENALMKGLSIKQNDRFQNIGSYIEALTSPSNDITKPVTNTNASVHRNEQPVLVPAEQIQRTKSEGNKKSIKSIAIITGTIITVIILVMVAVSRIGIAPESEKSSKVSAATDLSPISNTAQDDSKNTGYDVTPSPEATKPEPKATETPTPEPKATETPTPEPIRSSVDTEVFGYVSGNILNNGLIAQQGEYVYFSNKKDKNYLYKMKSDGSDLTRLASIDSKDINVSGDFIYFCGGQYDHRYLYKMPIKGGQPQKLIKEYCRYVSVVNNCVYYIKGFMQSDDTNLYRVNTDGSNKIKLTDTMTLQFSIANNKIYYIGFYDVKKQGIGEKNEMTLDGNWAYDICEANGWVYYVSDSSTKKLMRIKGDGTEKQDMGISKVYTYNISNDTIYYQNDGLNAMSLDGSNNRKISSGNFSNIIIYGDWIYYYDDENVLCKMNIDGTKNLKLQ